MVPVDDLDKGTHRGAAEDLLVGHRLGDAAGAAADARNKAVAVVARLRAVKALHDDSLLARIAPVQKDDNLAGLEAVGLTGGNKKEKKCVRTLGATQGGWGVKRKEKKQTKSYPC